MGSPAANRGDEGRPAPGAVGSTRWLGLVLVVDAGLLAAAAWANTHRLNVDGIAYLRLAGYYVEGPLRLAVSGYWGPLLSWLMAPALAAGIEPLVAARAVMALTGLVFAGGCATLLRTLGLRPWSIVAGTAVAGLAAVGWSVQLISPDLLVGGLIALALAATVRRRWAENGGGALLAGVLWGLAYLAKAVALPFAVLAVPLTAWRLRAGRREGTARWGHALAWTALGWGLAAGPWVGLLSAKYGRLTFSTAAKAAHAIVGPADQQRYHPFARRLHRPEPGRLTAWEDPTSLPYADWSPWASPDYCVHQLRVSLRNLATAVWLLSRLDLLHLGVLALISLAGWEVTARWQGHAAATGLSRGQPVGPSPPRRAGVAASRLTIKKDPTPALRTPATPAGLVYLWVAALVTVYLPGYLGRAELRYFYPSWPWVFAGTVVAAERLAAWLAPRSRLVAWWVLPSTLISFAAPPAIQTALAVKGLPQPAAVLAKELAEGIRRTDRLGPVAGSGLLGGDRTGLFTAFFLGQPWYGDQPGARPADWVAVGARWVVLSARRAEIGRLASDPHFRERTGEVLPELKQPEQWLRIFERVGPPPPVGTGSSGSRGR